ncbi:C-GCAxxG-C-C family protein [Ruminococcus flavefaciens]|uniref:C-GCAxxG-C-C family protein n=1 Tax=Ruminococcus flavefaciens TaxID=1265 RepID=UPI0026EE83A7|nr:C-GCAxxG-C-C family protein [Ruminococcus flavefaciens]
MKYDHADKACGLFAGGLNCAQAVFGAFSDITGMDYDLALRLSSSFGGGMGRMREVCGTCSAMFMVAGILYGLGESYSHEEKTEHYKRIQELAARFKEKHSTIICGELLKGLSVTSTPEPEKRTEQYYKVRPCVRFVRTAAEILDRYIAENPPECLNT